METFGGEKPRVSIVFNSFLKGQLGDEVFKFAKLKESKLRTWSSIFVGE